MSLITEGAVDIQLNKNLDDIIAQNSEIELATINELELKETSTSTPINETDLSLEFEPEAEVEVEVLVTTNMEGTIVDIVEPIEVE